MCSEVFYHRTHLHCSQNINIILYPLFFPQCVCIMLLPVSTILNNFIVKLCYAMLYYITIFFMACHLYVSFSGFTLYNNEI